MNKPPTHPEYPGYSEFSYNLEQLKRMVDLRMEKVEPEPGVAMTFFLACHEIWFPDGDTMQIGDAFNICRLAVYIDKLVTGQNAEESLIDHHTDWKLPLIEYIQSKRGAGQDGLRSMEVLSSKFGLPA